MRLPVTSDDTGRYRVITHTDGVEPQVTGVVRVMSGYAANNTTLITPFNDTDFIFDRNAYGQSQAERLLINKWGSDLEIEVYYEVKKVW